MTGVISERPRVSYPFSEESWQALDALGLPDDYIRPHDRVVLKPNWVKEHDERHPGPGR